MIMIIVMMLNDIYSKKRQSKSSKGVSVENRRSSDSGSRSSGGVRGLYITRIKSFRGRPQDWVGQDIFFEHILFRGGGG